MFSETRPFAAYVLDEWSFTILRVLGELSEAEVLKTLLFHADSKRTKEKITDDFNATLYHLKNLGLLEEDNAKHS